MSDDLRYTSSSQSDLTEDIIGENGSNASSGVLSELSDLSATRLVTHSKYAIIWELLQGCQEAAIEDIPGRYRECLSIFDTNHDDQGPVACQKYGSDAEYYDELFQAAGAIKSSEPWSLPAAARPVTKEDALWPPNMQVLSVTQVMPTAAVYLTPNAALADQFRRISENAASVEASEDARNDLYSASPLANPKTPLFASAAFTSASQIAHHTENPSFHVLWRYNRLATTSLLRQAHSFQVDSPVFGVLLQGSLVAFHVDWYEEQDGIVTSNSAMYAPNDEITDLKTWDLRNSIEAAEVKTILSNLHKYTAGPYTSQVLQGLKAVKGPLRPWKWHPSLLPEVLAYSRLKHHIEEPPEEKMDRWQESIAISMKDAFHPGRLPQTFHSGSAGLQVRYSGLRRRSRDFLSPPSTPQSLGDLDTFVL